MANPTSQIDAKTAATEEMLQTINAYKDATPEQKPAALNAAVNSMIENAGFDGPAERYIAGKKLWNTDPELYKRYKEEHTERTQKGRW